MAEPSLASSAAAFQYRLGALLYFRDLEGRWLLIRRRRSPNLGFWCPVGGKLEMPIGESPYECACREAEEEVGMLLKAEDLLLRCILSEKDYEGTGHWLMFVFEVTRRLAGLPCRIDEGEFQFFAEEELETVAMPELDREIVLQRILPQGRSLHILRVDDESSALVEEEVIEGGS